MVFKNWGCTLAPLWFGMFAGFAFCNTTWAEDNTKIGRINWRSVYADAAEEAAAANKPLLIEVTAVWCGACRQMQQLTFSDRRVIQRVESAYVPLVIDADEHPDLVAGFRVASLPTTLVVSPDLKILKRFTGYQSASVLLPELERIVQQQFAVNAVIQPASSTSVRTLKLPLDTVPPVSASEPANTKNFAFDGFDLVGILDDRKLRRGKPEFTSTFRDQELCFHSEQQLKKFLANPAKYWPVANGKCLVSERDGQEEAVGDPRLGVTWRGRLWLFADRDHQQRFIQSPRKYASSGM